MQADRVVDSAFSLRAKPLALTKTAGNYRVAGTRSGPPSTRDDQPFLAVFLGAFAFAGMDEVKASDRATHSSALAVFLCHDSGIIT
jgi:hypothetical protein